MIIEYTRLRKDMLAIQGSFLNSLLPQEDLDKDIVTPASPEWGETLRVWEKSDRFSLDIETFGQGKDGLNQWKGQIRLIQVGLPTGKILIVDLGGWFNRQEPPKGFMARLRDYLKKKAVIGANLKFDLLWLKVVYGFEARKTIDVMLMSQVLWAGLPIRHSLKAICERLGIEIDKTEQASDWGAETLTNAQMNYAAKDAQVVFGVWDKLHKQLKALKILGSANAECMALPAFVQMEYHGMPVDIEMLEDYLKKYEATCGELIKPFTDKFPGVNPDSSPQVVEALNSIGINVESSGADDLSPHWHIPEIRALSLWRTATTMVAYLQGCKDAYFDGAVRGVYRQINPSGFGRSTCGADKGAGKVGVNLQNPPNRMPDELERLLPKVREIFRPPAGKSMLVADLSSAHARIATQASGDVTLIEIYNSGKDLHSYTASGLAKVRGLDWTPEYINKARKDKSHPDHKQANELRIVAKPVFFGSANCQGAATLKKTVQTDAGMDISIDDCKDAIKGWRETYSGLFKFQQDNHKKVNKTNFTFPFCDGVFAMVRGLSGRMVYMAKLENKFKPNQPPEIKISDACSFVWTSCEADIIKLAMATFISICDDHHEWGAYIANMCHDEIDVICNSEFELEVAKHLQACTRAAMAKFINVIPPDDLSAKPESLLVGSWADK